MEWTFTVPGQPVPQPRARVSTRGGFARAYTPAKHPVHAFRQAVTLSAAAAGMTAIDGAYELTVEAVFARPASHLRKSGIASKAPAYPGHSCGDCDNIAKAVQDSLPFHDDTQVVRLIVSKRYASLVEPSHTVVSVRRL